MIKKICQIVIILFLSLKVSYADLYEVSDIPIVAELSSAKEARTAAIKNGETEAFWELMKKMVSAENIQQIPVPVLSEVEDWIQHVSLAEEKTTDTKYMAKMSVRFHEDKIQDFLMKRNIPFLTEDLPTFVVVPVFQKDNQRWTLDDQNPLYVYLKSEAFSAKNPEIVVPIGELEEVVWLQEFFETQNPSALKHFSDKYETDSVLILDMEQGDAGIFVRTGYEPSQPALENVVKVKTEKQDISDLIPGIWSRVQTEQKKLWVLLKTQDFKTAMTFWVQVPIKRLSEWNQLNQKLRKADFLENFSVRGFRPNEVWVTMRYNGTSDQLNRQLQSFGLRLDVGNINGIWMLTPVREKEE